jgi:hypothetical protein
MTFLLNASSFLYNFLTFFLQNFESLNFNLAIFDGEPEKLDLADFHENRSVYRRLSNFVPTWRNMFFFAFPCEGSNLPFAFPC